MKHILTYSQSRFSLREARLCFDELETPRVTPSGPETQQPIPAQLRVPLTNLRQQIANPPANNGPLMVSIEEMRKTLVALGPTNPTVIEIVAAINRIPGFPSVTPQTLANIPTTFTYTPQRVLGVEITAEQVRKTLLNAIEGMLARGNGAQKQKVEVDAAAKGKIEAAQEAKRKDLRARLLKLEAEIKTGAALKESTAQEKKLKEGHMEREREIIRSLIADNGIIFQQAGVTNIESQLRSFIETDNQRSAPLRKQLLEILAPLTQGQVRRGLMSAEGMMEMVTTMVSSGTSQAVQEFVRQNLGINVDVAGISAALFSLLRGKVAEYFSTLPLFNVMPDIQRQGREYHYRIALEAELASKVVPPPSFLEMFAMSNEQMQNRIPDFGGSAIRTSWDNLYAGWRTFAQTTRTARRNAALPPIPSVEQARTFASMPPAEARKQYVASLNGTVENQPTTTPVENGQPRQIGTLDFPASGIVPVEGTPRIIKHNNKDMKFEKNSDNHFLVKMQPDLSINRVIKFADAPGQEADALKLKAPAAPSTVTGDVEVVASKNGQERTIKLGRLAEVIEANPTKPKIIIRGNNDVITV